MDDPSYFRDMESRYSAVLSFLGMQVGEKDGQPSHEVPPVPYVFVKTSTEVTKAAEGEVAQPLIAVDGLQGAKQITAELQTVPRQQK